jgi:hypothetical protein
VSRSTDFGELLLSPVREIVDSEREGGVGRMTLNFSKILLENSESKFVFFFSLVVLLVFGDEILELLFVTLQERFRRVRSSRD